MWSFATLSFADAQLLESLAAGALESMPWVQQGEWGGDGGGCERR